MKAATRGAPALALAGRAADPRSAAPRRPQPLGTQRLPTMGSPTMATGAGAFGGRNDQPAPSPAATQRLASADLPHAPPSF